MAKRKTSAKRAPARKVARKKVTPIPKGYHMVTPYIICRGAARAIDFYKRAFGAKERLRMDAPNGTIAHAELQIGDSIVMLGDEMPQMGATAPETVGGTASGLFIYSKDVDRAFAQAVAAGAQTASPTPTPSRKTKSCQKLRAAPETAVSALQTTTPTASNRVRLMRSASRPNGTPTKA